MNILDKKVGAGRFTDILVENTGLKYWSPPSNSMSLLHLPERTPRRPSFVHSKS